MEELSRRTALRRWEILKAERSTWISHWREISDHLLPRSGRFLVQDRNDGKRKHNNIYDNTGTRALRILAAGMMSGMTSPARPWFKLATRDRDLMKEPAVKLWLAEAEEVMRNVFQRSNTYRALHSAYGELGAFGTAATIVSPDFENVIHHCPLTVGEYALATDWCGNVTTLYREFQAPVGAIVGEFGLDKVSNTIRGMYDRGNLDAWISLVHAIEPRADRDPSKRDAKNMPWSSVYFEAGSDRDTTLRESGYSRFPALCPRWDVCGGDIYGNSPGMEALGDIKQLQHEQLRKAQGIDYKTRPPLQAPTSMKNRDVEMLPGGISYLDAAGPGGGIKTAFEVNLDLSHLLADIQDVRERIRGSFYADMFLMISSQTDSRMTATEVAERHEEKLLMLGPVLERLQNELLDPLIEMTFERIVSLGILPPPPQELQGHEINVELVSMLAQAQRAIGTNSMDRFVSSIGVVAQLKPDVLDKVDGDAFTEIYGDALGIHPSIVVPADKVKAIRDARAQAQQAAMQSEAANQAADTAQKLANAQTTQPSALTSVAGAVQQPATLTDATRQFSGYT